MAEIKVSGSIDVSDAACEGTIVSSPTVNGSTVTTTAAVSGSVQSLFISGQYQRLLCFYSYTDALEFAKRDDVKVGQILIVIDNTNSSAFLYVKISEEGDLIICNNDLYWETF